MSLYICARNFRRPRPPLFRGNQHASMRAGLILLNGILATAIAVLLCCGSGCGSGCDDVEGHTVPWRQVVVFAALTVVTVALMARGRR